MTGLITLNEPLVLLVGDRPCSGHHNQRGRWPVPYLDKFTVTSEAQGEGLGALLSGRWSGHVTRLCTGARVIPTRSHPGIFSRLIAATAPRQLGGVSRSVWKKLHAEAELCRGLA